MNNTIRVHLMMQNTDESISTQNPRKRERESAHHNIPSNYKTVCNSLITQFVGEKWLIGYNTT